MTPREIAEARARDVLRLCESVEALRLGAAEAGGATATAWAARLRAVAGPGERLVAGALAGGRPIAASFAGMARAEFAGHAGRAGAAWQEIPIDDLRVGGLVVTLPVLAWDGDALIALDVIALDPVAPDRWARLTGLADVLAPEQERGRVEAPARLYRRPIEWWRAGCCTVAAWPRWNDGACILDPSGRDAADLLLGSDRLVCADADHAAEVLAWQRAARARLLRETPRPRPLAVADGDEIAPWPAPVAAAVGQAMGPPGVARVDLRRPAALARTRGEDDGPPVTLSSGRVVYPGREAAAELARRRVAERRPAALARTRGEAVADKPASMGEMQ